MRLLKKMTKVYNCVCASLLLVLVILQFLPFWNYNGKTTSICSYVWLHPQDNEILDYFSLMIQTSPNVNAIALTSIFFILLCVGGVILCIRKANSNYIGIVFAVIAIYGIQFFVLNPVFRLGETWICQFEICLMILLISFLEIISNIIKEMRTSSLFNNGSLTQDEIDERVEEIKTLLVDNRKKKQDKDSIGNFYRLLNHLSDEYFQCRIAACDALGETSSAVAWTHISYWLSREKDEKVICAMKKALGQIRLNMQDEQREF